MGDAGPAGQGLAQLDVVVLQGACGFAGGPVGLDVDVVEQRRLQALLALRREPLQVVPSVERLNPPSVPQYTIVAVGAAWPGEPPGMGVRMQSRQRGERGT